MPSRLLKHRQPLSEIVVWLEKGFAQGANALRDWRQSIAQAILPSIGHTLQRWAHMAFSFACRRRLCSASRTSRDTPQSSIFWTIIPLHPTLPQSPGVALRAMPAGARASPLMRLWNECRLSGKRRHGWTQEVNISLTLWYIWQDDRGKRRLDEQSAFPALNMPTP